MPQSTSCERCVPLYQLHESKPRPWADHGPMWTDVYRPIATSEMVLERSHCLTLYFDKQFSVHPRIDFAPTSTSTEAGVVQSQVMTPSLPWTRALCSELKELDHRINLIPRPLSQWDRHFLSWLTLPLSRGGRMPPVNKPRTCRPPAAAVGCYATGHTKCCRHMFSRYCSVSCHARPSMADADSKSPIGIRDAAPGPVTVRQSQYLSTAPMAGKLMTPELRIAGGVRP